MRPRSAFLHRGVLLAADNNMTAQSHQWQHLPQILNTLLEGYYRPSQAQTISPPPPPAALYNRMSRLCTVDSTAHSLHPSYRRTGHHIALLRLSPGPVPLLSLVFHLPLFSVVPRHLPPGTQTETRRRSIWIMYFIWRGLMVLSRKVHVILNLITHLDKCVGPFSDQTGPLFGKHHK